MTIDFDKLKDDLFSVGKEVGDRVSDVSNIAKLKLELRSKEDYIQRQFAELGRMYYETNKDNADAVAEQDMFQAIAETGEQIEEIKKSLLDLQGTICCPQCGEKYQKGYKFCPFCGGELRNEPEQEEDIFVDEEVVEAEVVDENSADVETTDDVATEEAEIVDETAEKETDLDALDGTVVKEVAEADQVTNCDVEEVKPAIEEAIEEAIEKEIQSKEAAENMQAE